MMHVTMGELRECDPIKRILENVVPEIDLKNNPFELFEWFKVTEANSYHALLNLILYLEGEPLIEYDSNGVTVDTRCNVPDEVKKFSALFRSRFTSDKRIKEGNN